MLEEDDYNPEEGYDIDDEDLAYCTNCNGTGEGMMDGASCSVCNGKGFVCQ